MNFEKLRDILVETLGCEPEEVTPEASLTDDLHADSLAVMELLMALEETAGIHIEDTEAGSLKTVQDVINYLNTHQA